MKTITIYTESENLKFQSLFPGGEIRKLRLILPPTEREFNNIINYENSTLKFDKKNEINKLQSATGRNFREVYNYIHLCKSDYEKYMNMSIKDISMRLESFINKESEYELNDFLKNLDILFHFRFYNKYPIFSQTFYDKGLIYHKDSTIEYLNSTTKKVLLKYYLDHFKVERIDEILMDGNDIKENMLKFYCIKTDLSLPISIKLFRSDQSTKSIIKYELNDFDYLENLDIGDGKKYFETTLLLSKNPLFPFIDYVIYIPESQKIIFKKITMSTISSHLKDTLKEYNMIKDEYKNLESLGKLIKFLCYPKYSWNKGLKTKKEGKSVCQIVLELLFGSIENYKVEIKDDIFQVFCNEKLLDIEIIYITGTKIKEKDIIFPLKNLLFCYREDLIKYNIPF